MHIEHFDIHYSAGYAPLGIPADALFTADDQRDCFANVTVQTPETAGEIADSYRAWYRLATARYGHSETYDAMPPLACCVEYSY